MRFLPNAVVYQSAELLHFIIGRQGTYIIYMAIVAGSLLLYSDRNVKVFGLLVFAVMAVTYAFFAYAYVSVFCFGGVPCLSTSSGWLSAEASRPVGARSTARSAPCRRDTRRLGAPQSTPSSVGRQTETGLCAAVGIEDQDE